jgi:hypothetical protein
VLVIQKTAREKGPKPFHVVMETVPSIPFVWGILRERNKLDTIFTKWNGFGLDIMHTIFHTIFHRRSSVSKEDKGNTISTLCGLNGWLINSIKSHRRLLFCELQVDFEVKEERTQGILDIYSFAFLILYMWNISR